MQLKNHQQANANKKEAKSKQEISGLHTGRRTKIKMNKEKAQKKQAAKPPTPALQSQSL